MFGESDSESPRVPSPWDHLISAPPSPAAKAYNSPIGSIPKLVPEAEEGNIEYKLQLLSPSPARFTRLVTQMKWRLLEGGGQAYYELGVADSGALVGLPRAELEQSLETLEMMAGEIGASVIVVREIEVPAVMAGLAGSETDYWNGKRRNRRVDIQSDASEGDSTTSTTEFETELSAMEFTDPDYGAHHWQPSPIPALFHRGFSASSSPALSPPLTLFPMDPEYDTGENDDIDGGVSPTFSVDLEIASVFKPRPMRNWDRHAHVSSTVARLSAPGTSFQLNSNKRTHMAKQKHHCRHLLHPATADPSQCHSHTTFDELLHTQTKQQAKAIHRRQARDRKRESKRKALFAHAAYPETTVDTVVPNREGHVRATVLEASREDTISSTAGLVDQEVDQTSANLVSGLVSLHAPVELSAALCDDQPIPITDTYLIPDLQLDHPADPGDIDIFAGHGAPSSPADNTKCGGHEPRLIIEALVVRKMSIEEAFLDFGGFSLISE